MVLSIEKYWWGGYLTGSEMYFGRRGVSLQEMYKQELYTINNLIRLVIVANSIAFFIIITMLEVLQVVFTFVYGLY